MAAAVRVVSVDRGQDPRDLCLIAFGGAGPAHAVRIARRCGIPTVIFPRGAGVASAMGLLHPTSGSRSAAAPCCASAMPGWGLADAIFQELDAALATLLRESRADPTRVAVSRAADLRYAGQGYESRFR